MSFRHYSFVGLITMVFLISVFMVDYHGLLADDVTTSLSVSDEVVDPPSGGGGGGGGPIDPGFFISTIKAKPEGRFGVPASNDDTAFALAIYRPGTQQIVFQSNQLLNLDVSGVYTGFIDLSFLSEGNYDISLKSKAHLSRRLNNVLLSRGENILNFTNSTNAVANGNRLLLGGDINGLGLSSSNLGDDTINSVDISILLRDFNRLDPTGNQWLANLNQDALVNEEDLNLMILNVDKTGENLN